MTIDANLDAEVAFITGVNADGSIAATSFRSWNDDSPATYGVGHAEKWGGGAAGTAGGIVTYAFDPASNWTPTEQKAFAATFALWSEVANVQFVQSSDPTSAQIDLTRSTSSSETDVRYSLPTSGGIGAETSATIQIATSIPGFGPLGASFSDYGGYPYQTLIHEEGHALGLGHAGPYNDGTTTDAQDEQQQFGVYDVQAYSIMSYIASGDTSAAYSGSEPVSWNYGLSTGDNGGLYANVPTTPQIADILAAQRLYGLPTSTPLSGGQTFGFHCNVSGPTEPFFDFTQNSRPVVTLWDEGSNNTLDLSGFNSDSIINLNQGAFSSCAGLSNNIAIAYGTQINTAIASSGGCTFFANSGNDTLYGGGGGPNVFHAGAGNDLMIGGSYNNEFVSSNGTATYIGGSSSDDVVLLYNPQNYYFLGQTNEHSSTFDVLLARDGSGTQFIDTNIPYLGFQDGDGSLTTPASLASIGVTSVGSAAGDTLVAPITGVFTFDGGPGPDKVVLNGNVGDYTLSRVQPNGSAQGDSLGGFVLTGNNGSGAYTLDENISTVQFQNGQYLSLKDLPAYVHGSDALEIGGSGNDLLYQTPTTAYELFIGGGGHDDLYLNGNVRDYALRSFTAQTAQDAGGQGGQSYSGLELVGDNGSGALLIDSSVETIHFQNGQYLAYGDLQSYIAAASPSSDILDIGLDGDGGSLVYQGASAANRALLNANAGGYSLSRDGSGDFVLDAHTATHGVENTVTLSEAVSTVQFANGQYLALKDLGAYVAGSDVFTQGTAANDLLFAPVSGDAYVVGGAGVDNLYLNGNTRDYTIEAVNITAANGHPAIDGYELLGDNGSGNTYIDQSTEVIHFQDGQYLAFQDLTAYITPFHG